MSFLAKLPLQDFPLSCTTTSVVQGPRQNWWTEAWPEAADYLSVCTTGACPKLQRQEYHTVPQGCAGVCLETALPAQPRDQSCLVHILAGRALHHVPHPVSRPLEPHVGTDRAKVPVPSSLSKGCCLRQKGTQAMVVGSEIPYSLGTPFLLRDCLPPARLPLTEDMFSATREPRTDVSFALQGNQSTSA